MARASLALLLLFHFAGLALAGNYIDEALYTRLLYPHLRASTSARLPGICQPLSCASTGHQCSTNVYCRNSYCNVTFMDGGDYTGKCLSRHGDGGVCFNSGHCNGDQTQCDNYGICRSRRDRGHACTHQGTCKYGVGIGGDSLEDLECDPVKMKCVSVYTQKEGQPCGYEIEYGQSRWCQGGMYCNMSMDGKGNCLQLHHVGANCTSSAQCFGHCLDLGGPTQVCVDYFSIPSGLSCHGTASLCKSGVCGSSTGICMEARTPSDGSGPVCDGPNRCAPDALCLCNYKTGVSVCYGPVRGAVRAIKAFLHCLNRTDDLWDCKGKVDSYYHQSAMSDNEYCSGSASITVSLLLALVAMLARLF
jgi:hypothetical protein